MISGFVMVTKTETAVFVYNQTEPKAGFSRPKSHFGFKGSALCYQFIMYELEVCMWLATREQVMQ